MNSLNPQDAFALVSLESAAVKHGTAAGNRSDPPPDDPREISSTEDVIASLNDTIKIKLNRSLADPGQLTFAAMRDLKKVIDLVREMESRAAKEREQGDHGRGGLSDETAGRIRRKIPGMTDESEEDDIRQE